VSGVEVQATLALNLLRNDWLRTPAPTAEAALLTLTGALAGFALVYARPRRALLGALASVVVLALIAVLLCRTQRLWFTWLIPAGVQLPFACAWSLLAFIQRAAARQEIPDHTLLRRIGQGAYGDVWLARDAIGGCHAVKIVERRRFPRPDPFEREFHGIQQFAPISRSHPGLVQILHVGRNDLRRAFFYIMEAADDLETGPAFDPARYFPRTLAAVLARRGRLPADQCMRLALDLADALDHLHRHQLVHRDLKPANILFVNHLPKLADPGLVTPTASDGRAPSRVGTEGYIAPEGPGRPAADLYALGKLLYQAATGCDLSRFPDLPSTLTPGPDADLLVRLHEVLLTACETDPADRYPSAQAMRADLLKLQVPPQPLTPSH
jgi:serine/threonine protein kinase